MLHREVKADRKGCPEAVIDGDAHNEKVPVVSEVATMLDDVPAIAHLVLLFLMFFLDEAVDD